MFPRPDDSPDRDTAPRAADVEDLDSPRTTVSDRAAFPAAAPGPGNLDATAIARAKLAERERRLMLRIAQRIVAREFELPRLPSTTLLVMDLAAQQETEVETIAETIGADPALAAEFLKAANSALFAGAVPTETLHAAVVRLGRRALRSVLLTVSMRGAILKHKALEPYAKEVWRQATSVGALARIVAPHAGLEPEHGFLLGLLHDVGKVSLLYDIAREVDRRDELAPALVGNVFARFHEIAGEALARAWHLSDELCAVAGCHHAFEKNAEHPSSAALVLLAHRMDLALSAGEEASYGALTNAPEMVHLGLPAEARHAILAQGLEAYRGLADEGRAAA